MVLRRSSVTPKLPTLTARLSESVPAGSSFAAETSVLSDETTSVVGIFWDEPAAWVSLPPSVPDPHAVSSSAAEVIRAKGMKRAGRGREDVRMACGSPGRTRQETRKGAGSARGGVRV